MVPQSWCHEVRADGWVLGGLGHGGGGNQAWEPFDKGSLIVRGPVHFLVCLSSPCLMLICSLPSSWKSDLICSSCCLPWFWFCQSSFLCMQQDVLPTAAFCIYLVLFLSWVLPVCSCTCTCFRCWWSHCSDTYVKCLWIVCGCAVTMAQNTYMLLLVTLFSMLILGSRQAIVSCTLSSALSVSMRHKSLL